MDVLLCWSKERSRLVARALYEWLPQVLPGVKPWMSELDIDKGKDWNTELHKFLSVAKAVIVCITSENVRSPWIYYEAGYVASGRELNLVCPFLLGEQPSILQDGPLSRMQSTVAEKEDVLRLLRSLCKQVRGDTLANSGLEQAFETKWGDLSGTLKRLRDMEFEKSTVVDFVVSDVDQLAGGQLSSEARTIVIETGKSKRGRFYHSSDNRGIDFLADGKKLNADSSARSTARWTAALKTLQELEILEMQGNQGYCFALTAKGFELYDLLVAQN